MNEWRRIPKFPDYAISQQGIVKRITPAAGTYVGKVIKPFRNQTECLAVILAKGASRSVSRLNNRKGSKYIDFVIS